MSAEFLQSAHRQALLRNSLTALVDRIEKFIDRRFVDDGPDWEYSKLHDCIEDAKAAIEETK